jgi:hydroxymethylbilane synthase
VVLRLGTRGSPLARWQADHVADALRGAWPGLVVDVVIIKTEGDRSAELPQPASFGKGIFVKEIEEALLRGTIDLAVHSLKDLPTETPAGLALAAIPKRHDARDALISRTARRVEDLPRNALVATGSPRRRCQLLHVRRDLRFAQVRGNVDTRLRKLDEGRFDALILAVSGIERLGLTDAPYTPIPFALCLPAPGQGALAIETRADDESVRRHVAPLNDEATARCVTAERAFLATLGAGCLAPAAASATMEGDTLALDGMVGYPDGRERKRDRLEGAVSDAERVGATLARRLLDAGAELILREVREAERPGGS